VSTLPRRSATSTATTAAAAPASRPSQGSTATTIGIRDAREPAPGIGTGVKGPKVEEPAAQAAGSSAASSPDMVLARLVPVPAQGHAKSVRGVMAYAAQAAERAQAKTAVSLPAALIDVA